MTSSKRTSAGMRSRRKKIWNLVLAIFFFVLGVIGILIPVMPQFIFFAMSLFFLAQVFPPVRRWMRRFLRRHPRLERAYREWRAKARRKRQAFIRKRRETEGRVRDAGKTHYSGS